jgi:hypothetical protein
MGRALTRGGYHNGSVNAAVDLLLARAFGTIMV